MKVGDRFDIVLGEATSEAPTPQDVGLHKVEDGKPIPPNVALLKATHCETHPDRLHAEVVYAPEPKKPAKKPERSSVGPARVSNTKFRSGWDHVFGDKEKPN